MKWKDVGPKHHGKKAVVAKSLSDKGDRFRGRIKCLSADYIPVLEEHPNQFRGFVDNWDVEVLDEVG